MTSWKYIMDIQLSCCYRIIQFYVSSFLNGEMLSKSGDVPEPNVVGQNNYFEHFLMKASFG